MEIKLENIYVNKRLSRRQTEFQATLYINGYKVGVISYDGRGGAIIYHAFEEKGNILIREAEAWCRKLPPVVFPDSLIDGKPLTIPMDLEIYLENIITAWLEKKDLRKFRQKMEKEMKTAIVFGVPDKTYRVMRYKMPIESLIKFQKGVDRLRIDIQMKILPYLQERERILNTNIPPEVMKTLGIGQ